MSSIRDRLGKKPKLPDLRNRLKNTSKPGDLRNILKRNRENAEEDFDELPQMVVTNDLHEDNAENQRRFEHVPELEEEDPNLPRQIYEELDDGHYREHRRSVERFHSLYFIVGKILRFESIQFHEAFFNECFGLDFFLYYVNYS